MAQSPQITDDTPTLLAAGIVAYVAETLAHEALGHGGVCLASGGSLLVLAPLWIRCSVTTLLLVAAGPAVNVLAAQACFAALRMAKPRHALTGLLLWLGFIFNALVACGYLAVGAASGFGDWPYLFAAVRPQLAWRAPGLFLAACGYYGCLRAAAALFRDLAGTCASLRRGICRLCRGMRGRARAPHAVAAGPGVHAGGRVQCHQHG